MDDLIRTFSERGDLAHLALFLWAARPRRHSRCLRCASLPARCGASTISCASSRASTKALEAPMDTLHAGLRAIRGETRPCRAHLAVFREFLAHLDRAAKRVPGRSVKSKPHPKRSGKR
jgi:hypothetical protein